ncbi:hypothetical protein [Desulfitobacterium hafniense]|uniref:hypothetical protein n=1 Tax=Desulfitobacterium hafniense TaxID=49338 RepID=UPI000375C4C2|nr:hypothetical protein [Desulfitobacterium hafniense]
MKMRKSMVFSGLALVLMMFILTGCIPGDGSYDFDKPAGFLSGVWHGWIAPLSLIMGIFSETVRVYEVFNTGWWYDFGFYIAVISGFGGLSLSRKKKKDK